VPAHIDLDSLRSELRQVGGTEDIHDLHVWTLTTGQYALSAHAVMDGSVGDDDLLNRLQAVLSDKFAIDHVTIQLERTSRKDQEPEHF
jgi:cobalt-zinc-cadmium efflux system protein